MPSRKNVARVKTTGVMGDGSYVLVRKLTNGEAREFLRDLRDRKAALREQILTEDTPREVRDIRRAELDAEDTDKAIADSLRTYMDHILDWNWVYEDKKDMPKPPKAGAPKEEVAAFEAVLDELTQDETRALASALGLKTDEDLKN